MAHNRLEQAESGAETPAPVLLTGEAVPGLGPVRDPRLEAYLARVVDRLPRSMPPANRESERAELAAHLDALVAAHVELGRDPDTAVQAALHEFGNAGRLGHQLGCAWSRSTPPAVSALVAVTAMVELLLVAILFTGGLPQYPTPALGPPPFGNLLSALVPALAGYVWGRRKPVGVRWCSSVLLPLLLGCALLPLSPGAAASFELQLFARLLILFQWSTVACLVAASIVTREVIRQRLSPGTPLNRA